MNARQRKIYEGLLKVPPTDDQHALGAAYWMGRRNPKMRVNDAGPIVGAPGSDARAAFMAGKRSAHQLSREDERAERMALSLSPCLELWRV